MTWVAVAGNALARWRAGAHDAQTEESGQAHGGAEVIPRRRPPLLDSTGLRAVIAPASAAMLWAAAVLREATSETPLDPLGLFVRLVALALTVRAISLGAEMLRRIRVWISTYRYGLALTSEGLLYRTPQRDIPIALEDIVAVREHGDWGRRSGPRRWSDVYLVLRPGAQHAPYVALPPIFERTPGVLAERLMRWRAPPPHVAAPDPAPSNRLASRIYDEAAAGRIPQGGLVISHGRQWLRRGPYATILLSVVIVEGFLRLPIAAWQAIPPAYPLGMAACLALVPMGWIVLTHRHVAPRKGIALVFTPSDLLMRTREGVIRVQWRKLVRARIEAKGTWSLVEGYHLVRRLALEREEATTIRYDEAFLGLPVEVAEALCEAYKQGTIQTGTPERTAGAEAAETEG